MNASIEIPGLILLQPCELTGGLGLLLVYGLAVAIARRQRIREHEVAAFFLVSIVFAVAGARCGSMLSEGDGSIAAEPWVAGCETVLLLASGWWLCRALVRVAAGNTGRKASAHLPCRQVRFQPDGSSSAKIRSSSGSSKMAPALQEEVTVTVEVEMPASSV